MVPNIQWTPVHDKKYRFGLFFCSILEFPLIINDKIFSLGDGEYWATASLDMNRKPFRGSYLQRCVMDSYNGWCKKVREEYVPEMKLEDTQRMYKYWFVHSSGDRMVDYPYAPAEMSPVLSLPDTFMPVYRLFVQKYKPYKVNRDTAWKFLVTQPTKHIKSIK